jgi:hypothetical protein
MEADRGLSSGILHFYFNRADDPKSSGWVENPYYVDYTVNPGKEYEYSFKMKDHFGNVTESSAPVKVTTRLSNFTIGKDDFSQAKNYLGEGTPGTLWDGLVGKEEKQSAKRIIAANNVLTLESQGTNWDGNTPYGPFLYKEVRGDFVAEVRVADVSGLASKKVAGNNEVGLMVRLPQESTGGGGRPQLQVLQNGIFPAWNVGNLFTNFQNGRREQTNTQSAWNYNNYLQIQREGNVFYVRTSKDGINWTDLPGSPVVRREMDSRSVQVGLYQSTYGPLEAYGSFSDFKLIQFK